MSAQEIEYPYVHDLKGAVLQCCEKKFSIQSGVDGIEKGQYLPKYGTPRRMAGKLTDSYEEDRYGTVTMNTTKMGSK